MSRKLRDYIPAMKYGAKIMPEDLAGFIGVPYVGSVAYIDPTGGSDGNAGNAQNDAFKTLAAAKEVLTSGQQEVVMYVPTGGTGRSAETTAIDWNLRFTHIVGSCAPTAQDPRSGISFGVGGSLDIGENGCVIKNITLASTADINVPVTLSGSYNSLQGVDFKGSMNATAGDDAAARALYINGGQENTFAGCTFGSDTYNRSAANATLELANAASRNVFYGCQFIMAADNVAPLHVKFAGTSSIDRWLRFDDTLWYSFWANNTDKITAVMNLSAQTATGHVLLTGSQVMVGADDWEASASGRIYMQPASATANAIGIAINPTVT